MVIVHPVDLENATGCYMSAYLASKEFQQKYDVFGWSYFYTDLIDDDAMKFWRKDKADESSKEINSGLVSTSANEEVVVCLRCRLK